MYRKTLLFTMTWFFFCCAVCPSPSKAQIEESQKRFGIIFKHASLRLNEVAQKRPLKLKNWNDSLTKTSEAIQLMQASGASPDIFPLLEEAKAAYDQNSFASLLQGVFLQTQGLSEEASRYFEEFLLKSQTYSDFEKSFLSWKEFHEMRRIVYEILQSRGISFEGREKQIQVRIPYEAFFQYVTDPENEDWLMNLFFIVMILGGGVALVLSSFMGVDFSRPAAGNFVLMYFLIWIAYSLWIFDLAFGLPFELKRTVVVPVLLGVAAFGWGLMELIGYFKEKNRPLEDGYRRCPHCHAVIIELATECPECRRAL